MRTAIVLFSFMLGGAGGFGALGAQQSRAGLALTVTDAAGVRLQGVQVVLAGPTDRMGETDLSGQVSFASILPGTYRLRFAGDGLTTFEREVSLPAGKILPIDITLSRAPAPRRFSRTPGRGGPRATRRRAGPSPTACAASRTSSRAWRTSSGSDGVLA